MALILGPEPQGLLVVSYRRRPVVQLHGQRRQAQELPGAVRPLVAPVLPEHVQQIIEFAALPPQLAGEKAQGGDIFGTTHPDAGQAVHHAVQVLIARQPG